MGRWRVWVGWVLGTILLPVWLAHGADDRGFGRVPVGEKRVALVIGNNDYAHTEKLKNAVADAQAMKQALTSLGFEVLYRQNVSRREMNNAVDEFTSRLATDAVGLFFYAGHGVQIKSGNYLLPVDLQAEKDGDVIHDGIDVARVLEQMAETRAKFSLVILDACRDNPFKGVGSRGVGAARGLAPYSSDASGIMVVYSAGANQKALDRLGEHDRDKNGLFTRELLKGIRRPGAKVQDVIHDVKLTVIEQARAIGHEQTPAIYDQSVGTFFFVPQIIPPVAESETPAVHKPALPTAPASGGLVGMDSERVAKRVVKVRAEANAKSGLLRELKEGEKVHVLGRSGDGGWYKVEVKVGKELKDGFVAAEGLVEEKVWTEQRQQQEREARQREEQQRQEAARREAEQRAQEEAQARAEALRREQEELAEQKREEARQEEEQEKAKAAERRLAKAEYRCGKEQDQAKATCQQAGNACAREKASQFGGGMNTAAAALITLSCTTEVSLCNTRANEDYDACVEAYR